MQNNKHSLVAKLLALTTSLLVIGGCSVFGGKQAPETIPLPPKNLNNSAPIMLPQPGNAARPIISESAAAMANESQATRFKRITEQRGPGGAVNKITVDNPSGGLPDYTLTPNQQYDTNNNPDKLTTPNWGWNF
ncbi:MAG: hypothetical protein K2X04_03140 [Burkholderiales bacterium]|nr:hypothetical protein [Burkholderiales bacterium]